MKKLALTLAIILGITLGGNAQNNPMHYQKGSRGLFDKGMTSGEDEFNNRGVINSNNVGGGITNDDFVPTPLGSGLLILVGAGLGYVALKKKEDEQ